MMRVALMLLGAVLLSAGIYGVPRVSAVSFAAGEDGPEKPAVKAVEPYEGFESDRASLRKTFRWDGGPGRPAVNASSGEAIAAAQRIFRSVPFLFKTRQEVLDILGDPATISDYGQRPADRPDSPLVYRFDHGYGGYQYTLGFDGGKVHEIRVGGIY